MTKLVGNRSRSLLLCLAVTVAVGCWPRARTESLDPSYNPATLLDGYEYAVTKAEEWSTTSFLEGAGAGYTWQGTAWKPNRLSYVFVDVQRRESILIVLRLETRVAELNPGVPIEASQVSTLPFLLLENPVDEREALHIADLALGKDVALKCRNPELTLRGHGFGENQYWAVTYATHEPTWRVVGELSVDAVTGQVVSPRDFTDGCRE